MSSIVGFISGNKCPTLVGMMTVGKAMLVWGRGLHGTSLNLPLSFAITSKKNKFKNNIFGH